MKNKITVDTYVNEDGLRYIFLDELEPAYLEMFERVAVQRGDVFYVNERPCCSFETVVSLQPTIQS